MNDTSEATAGGSWLTTLANPTRFIAIADRLGRRMAEGPTLLGAVD